MEKTAKGTVYVFGNNVDIDQIYPGKYVEYTEMEDIRKYAMSGSEIPDLANIFQPGEIIIGGTNFGCVIKVGIRSNIQGKNQLIGCAPCCIILTYNFRTAAA